MSQWKNPAQVLRHTGCDIGDEDYSFDCLCWDWWRKFS